MTPAFQKARPDRHRFPSIDAAVVRELGGVEKRPTACMLASWLLGGATLEEKVVWTPKGKVYLPVNHTWGSLLSAQEDVLSAVGVSWSYGTYRHAVRQLRSAGLIERKYDPLPATRGAYGTVYALSESLLTVQSPTNVSVAFRHRHYGDPEDFRHATIVTGTLETGRARRYYGDADTFERRIKENYSNVPAYTNIGRWRRGESMDPTKPVFIPWFTMDIDRAELRDAYEDTQEIAQRLSDAGFDLDRTVVSFSGRKGFHVQIGADQIGCPIFADTEAAKIACDELSARLTHGIAIDSAVNSPNQLIRVAGSRHDKSGLYKVSWTLADFLSTDFETTMIRASEPHPSPDVDPRARVEVEIDLHSLFDEVAMATEARYTALRERKAAGGGAGETVKALLGGVTEGQSWHVTHEGRNLAGFILSCFLLEDRPTGDTEIDATVQSIGHFEALALWNERNRPPMRERELWSVFCSAHRRIVGGRPRR